MKKRWLYGGLLYRKIFEPLDIAEYFRDKLRNYETQGRPQQYIVLEEWLREDLQQKEERRLERGLGPISYATPNIGLKREERAFIGTQDSLFSAKVEEAIIVCDLLKEQDDQSQIEDQIKLKDFENYVWGLLTRYEVSLEIFLRKSSFMTWWDKYRRAMGSSYSSPLYNFMKSGEYIQHEKGDWYSPLET